MDRMTGEQVGIDDLYRSLGAPTTDTAVSVILKLRGETCDIDCLYCYETRKEAPGGARIGVEQIERLSAIFGDRTLAIELHGGEPLTVGKDQMRKILQSLAAAPNVLARRGRRVGVITAVTPKILDRPEAVLDHLSNFEAINAVSFVPVFDGGVTQPTASPGSRTLASRELQRTSIAAAAGPNWAVSPSDYVDFVRRSLPAT